MTTLRHAHQEQKHATKSPTMLGTQDYWTYLGGAMAASAGTPSDQQLLLQYATNDMVYACAARNANGVAQTPLRLYVRTGPGHKQVTAFPTRRLTSERETYLRKHPNLADMLGQTQTIEELSDHPLLTLLRQDHDGLDGYLLLALTQTYKDILGRAYWRLERSAVTGLPTKIHVLQPQRVLPVRNVAADMEVVGYVYQTCGGPWLRLAVEDVIDFRNPALDDPRGWGHSPLKAAYRQGLLTSKFAAYQDHLLDNRARPDWVFVPDEPLGPDMAERAEEAFAQKFGDQRNGGVWVAPSGGKAMPMQFSPTDLGPLEINKETRARLATAFDVPEVLLSAGGATYANLEKAIYLHAKFGILPRCLPLEQRLNVRLAPLFGPRLFLAFDNPVPEDDQFDLEKKTFAAQNGAMTRNEIRQVAGLGPLVGGDALGLPSPPAGGGP